MGNEETDSKAERRRLLREYFLNASLIAMAKQAGVDRAAVENHQSRNRSRGGRDTVALSG